MIPWLGTLWLASLIGSVHCAAMCGPFACLAAADQGLPRLSRHWHYQLGRLTGYLLLGALAGGAGHWLDRAGMAAGVARAAVLVMAVILVGWGVRTLLGTRGELRLPEAVTRRAGALLLALSHRPVALRGTLTGLLTALLPCGWLWVFVAAAMGTGSAGIGALAMAVFWAGSTPALALVVAGAARVAGHRRVGWPKVSAVLIMVMGLTALAVQLELIPAAHWLHRVLPIPPVFPGASGG